MSAKPEPSATRERLTYRLRDMLRQLYGGINDSLYGELDRIDAFAESPRSEKRLPACDDKLGCHYQENNQCAEVGKCLASGARSAAAFGFDPRYHLTILMRKDEKGVTIIRVEDKRIGEPDLLVERPAYGFEEALFARCQEKSIPSSAPVAAWIGCGECDEIFACYEGRQACVRLDTSKGGAHPREQSTRTSVPPAARGKTDEK